jgi:predicted NAD/FAD-binding protein
MKKKVAVIGSGISGISSAWFLAQGHDVTLFEKNDYLGGHTHTVDVPFVEQGVHQAVDTGFIVYNEPNYPLLTKMLDYLGIKTENTDMSFGVSINQGKLEYAGSNLNTLFAQRRNLFSADHWSLIFEILRFNKQAKSDLNAGLDSITLSEMSLGDYLEKHGFSDALQRHYLLPMAAAIWSCPTELMKQFPVISFLRFFNNHGLLNVNDRPQWKTVTNGSRSYLEAILNKKCFKLIQSEVIAVEMLAEKVRLQDANQHWHEFDEVVFACHADQTRKLLPGKDFALLDAFKYQPNDTWLHSDESLMPKNNRTWSSWNYLSDQQDTEPFVSVTYWMNHLQNFKTPKPVFVTLNPPHPPADEHVWMRMSYDHPVFDEQAMTAQTQLRKLQGKRHCWFTGSYFGYGFHEDGLHSAAKLAKLWGLPLPWERKQNSHEDLANERPQPLSIGNSSDRIQPERKYG